MIDKIEKRRGESGQTLILGVIAMVILVLAIILLLDIQNVIRTKVKSQSGVDAAALAGAAWQKESLNLIGELNMVKACTVLVSDIAPFGDDSPEGVTQSSELLTEMQARVSFVGPTIGAGAAQQAAKNNGVNYNREYSSGLYYNMIRRIVADREAGISQTTQGYEWSEPYEEMLNQLYASGNGMAVKLSCDPALMPQFDTDAPEFISYLTSEWVYQAIHANEWCALRTLIRMDFGTKWWGNIELVTDEPLMDQAFILPLDVDYFTGAAPYYWAGDHLNDMADDRGLTVLRDRYDDADPGDPDDTDGEYDPLPSITWCVYGEEWSNYAPAAPWWTDSIYLHSDMMASARYGGAICAAGSSVAPSIMSGRWNMDNPDSGADIGDAMSFSNQDIYDSDGFDTYGGRMSDAEDSMRDLFEGNYDAIESVSLAKPIGGIDDETPPHATAMVLPVFTGQSVFPVSIDSRADDAGAFDYRWYCFLTEYLPALGSVESLDQMSADMLPDPGKWGWFLYYHNALLKLDNPDWRQTGIDWLESPAEYDDDGNVVSVNEDLCDSWPDGGGGGPRSGPSVLH